MSAPHDAWTKVRGRTNDTQACLDTLIDNKVHERRSRLSWVREPVPRVSSASLGEISKMAATILRTGAMSLSVRPRHEARLEQFVREGVRYTAQAFQQMRPNDESTGRSRLRASAIGSVTRSASAGTSGGRRRRPAENLRVSRHIQILFS